MPVQWWQIFLALFGAALSFVSVAYWTRVTRYDREQERLVARSELLQDRLEEERKDIVERLVTLERSLAVVNQQVIPISTALQTILVKELTHFHTPVMDELMTRIGPPSLLSSEEEEQLTACLLERTLDMGQLITDSERDAAFILPAIMRRAKAEACIMKKMQTVSTFRFVTVEVPLDEERAPA